VSAHYQKCFQDERGTKLFRDHFPVTLSSDMRRSTQMPMSMLAVRLLAIVVGRGKSVATAKALVHDA
jgi:hypothetical protein